LEERQAVQTVPHTLVDGRIFEINHHDFVWIPEQNLRVMHVTDGEGHEVIINTTIVVSLQRIDPQKSRTHPAKANRQ
jgi:hypothetical protein